MVSLKNKQSGFTIVELLIVIIIIGILAGLVITQILGANAKARDTERKTDLNGLTNQLETYYAKAAGYPSAAQIADETWRTGNEFNAGDDAKSLADPRAVDNKVLAATIPATGGYAYVAEPAACVAPTADDGTTTGVTGVPCESFRLVALLENAKDKDGTNFDGSKPLSDPDQAYYVKRSAAN